MQLTQPPLKNKLEANRTDAIEKNVGTYTFKYVLFPTMCVSVHH